MRKMRAFPQNGPLSGPSSYDRVDRAGDGRRFTTGQSGIVQRPGCGAHRSACSLVALADRLFAHSVADMDRTAADDLGVTAAEMEFAATLVIDECSGVVAIPASEFSASVVS
jgi:hypothetical protein